MKIIRGKNNIKVSKRGCVLTIGNFDGMHRGHQALLDVLTAKAKTLKLSSTLMTFEPYPSEFFSQDTSSRLMLWRDKYLYLQNFAIDNVIVLPFNARLANISAIDFVRDILVDKLFLKHIIVGGDFRFGHNREGDIDLLKQMGMEFGFSVESIDDVLESDKRISSSRIRNCLIEGKIEEANALLGHTYTISGRIVHGDKQGTRLGFPTANIPLEKRKMVVHGIYVVEIVGLESYILPGVASVGTRPTLDGKHKFLEVYIFDFNQEIYGSRIGVQFLKKLRDEEKYDSIDKLVHQMKLDVKAAESYFERKTNDRNQL